MLACMSLAEIGDHVDLTKTSCARMMCFGVCILAFYLSVIEHTMMTNPMQRAPVVRRPQLTNVHHVTRIQCFKCKSIRFRMPKASRKYLPDIKYHNHEAWP